MSLRLMTYNILLSTGLGRLRSVMRLPTSTMTGLKRDLVDRRDHKSIQARRPLLIAHQGGVVGPGAPENSLAALRLAGAHGYDMVELDVHEAADQGPVLFHCWTGTLRINCGVDQPIWALTSEQLRRVRYLRSDEHIASLEEALHVCQSQELGVMLDIKLPDRWPSRPIAPSIVFLERIGELLRHYGLAHASCAGIAPEYTDLARSYLPGTTLNLVQEGELSQMLSGPSVSLEGRYWFGVPRELPSHMVAELQQRGLLVIAAINTFQYPAHAHQHLAHDDIKRLHAAGVDAFQVDSIYEEYFRHPTL